MSSDHDLGMDREISRRDFLNGVSLIVGASLVSGRHDWLDALVPPVNRTSRGHESPYYPPAKTGLRGSHDGSWEVAHALRDGKSWPDAPLDHETYDLIIVGAGISGLSAAFFYRELAGPQARILILDNHDDFGGHAKRNEFHDGQRLLIGYGGTQSIEAPGHYSSVAIGLLRKLGIDVQRFYRYFDQKLYDALHLAPGVFFDRETFGSDRLVRGIDLQGGDELKPEVVAQMPIADAARQDLLRLANARTDYLAGLTPVEKTTRLRRTSYKDFLLNDVKTHPEVVKVLQSSTHDLFCVGIDAVSAATCARWGWPGFRGVGVATSTGEEEPYIFHFPDGNASIARLLVRSLIPGAAPGHTMEDIVTAPMRYARLDVPASRVRVRLNSTAVRARHVGDPATAREVEVTYVRDGRAHRVRAGHCVLAGWNMMIPYLCPELPEAQRSALAYGVKQPLVYTNVQIRNWTSFEKLGVSEIYSPAGYFTSTTLDFPVSMGTYQFPRSPSDSCVLHLMRTPCKPGLPCKEQFKAGRQELFATPFEAFERQIRDQLGRMLGGGGFDPARDIAAITVNRWPHGYAYEYNDLFEPVGRPASERPCVIGRQPFGRISIANSDADGHAYTWAAIEQAHRAVHELTHPEAPGRAVRGGEATIGAGVPG